MTAFRVVIDRSLCSGFGTCADLAPNLIDLGKDGIAGDRIIQVRNARGRILTARTRPGLLRHRATLAGSSDVLVDGRPWRADDVAHEVEEAAGRGGPGSRAPRGR